MIYLYPDSKTSSFSVFNDVSTLPEKYRSQLIEIESLPEGEGILRRAGDGSFYYEPFASVEPIEPIEPEPVEPQPIEPVETIDEKLERVLQQLEEQRKHNAQLAQSNLDLLDVNLTIYEELLYMQERLNNA